MRRAAREKAGGPRISSDVGQNQKISRTQAETPPPGDSAA